MAVDQTMNEKELEVLFKKHFNRRMPGVIKHMLSFEQFRREYKTLFLKVIIPALKEANAKGVEVNGPISDLTRNSI